MVNAVFEAILQCVSRYTATHLVTVCFLAMVVLLSVYTGIFHSCNALTLTVLQRDGYLAASVKRQNIFFVGYAVQPRLTPDKHWLNKKRKL